MSDLRQPGLRGEEPPMLTAVHAVHVLEIILAAHESALGDRSVSLETSFDPPDGQDTV